MNALLKLQQSNPNTPTLQESQRILPEFEVTQEELVILENVYRSVGLISRHQLEQSTFPSEVEINGIAFQNNNESKISLASTATIAVARLFSSPSTNAINGNLESAPYDSATANTYGISYAKLEELAQQGVISKDTLTKLTFKDGQTPLTFKNPQALELIEALLDFGYMYRAVHEQIITEFFEIQSSAINHLSDETYRTAWEGKSNDLGNITKRSAQRIIEAVKSIYQGNNDQESRYNLIKEIFDFLRVFYEGGNGQTLKVK